MQQKITDLISLRHGNLFFTEGFLVRFGVSVSTIRDGMKRYRKHQSKLWENNPTIKLGRKKLINFDTIDWVSLKPFSLKNGPEIPNKQALINQLKSIEKEEKDALHDNHFDSLPDIWITYFKGTDEKWFQDTYNVNKFSPSGEMPKGQRGPSNRANQLAHATAIFRMLTSITNLSTTGYATKKDLQLAITRHGQNIYGVPTSYARLRKKESEFKKAIADPNVDERSVLVSGHHGNTRGLKFDQRHRTVLLEYYLDPRKVDKLECWTDYKGYMMQVEGLDESECISYSRFKQITLQKDIDILAAKCRHGGPYYETHVRPYILNKPPEYSLSLVAGDGWMPGRSVKHQWRNRKTGRREQRIGGMNVWLWFDAKSSCILSHNVDAHENSHQIRMSFRDIISLHGVSPLSIIVDKKWQEQSDTGRMFEKLGVLVQNEDFIQKTKRAYNPKSNPAERNNKELNKIHRRLDRHWVDMTNNTVQFKHNEEHVRKAGPMAEADLRAMVYQIIEQHNHMPRKSLHGRTPYQVFAESINPDARSFSPLELTWIFGETRIEKVRNYNVKIKLASLEHTFCIMGDDIKKYIHTQTRNDDKIRAYFDERHLDTVDIYAITDEQDESGDLYICTAINAESIRVNKANVEEKPNHKFSTQRARGKAIDDFVAEELEEQEQMKDSLGWDTAAFMNVSQEKYKDVHSNAVASQYRNYHQEQEEENGHVIPVNTETSKTQVLTEEQRFEKMKEMAKQFTKE